MKIRKPLLLFCTFGAALGSQAAITVADVENALINDGAPASVKYLDIQDTAYTNGFTLTTDLSGGDWGYPDTSNNFFVDGSSLDDKGENTPEIEAVISGLAADTDYDLWTTIKWSRAGTELDFDFAWGTTSGSLTTVVLPNTNTGQYVPGATTVYDPDSNPDSSNVIAYPLGTLTSDATGNLILYMDNGNDYASGSPHQYRSQIDGLAIAVVPEPAHAAALLGLGGMALVLYRRRR